MSHMLAGAQIVAASRSVRCWRDGMHGCACSCMLYSNRLNMEYQVCQMMTGLNSKAVDSSGSNKAGLVLSSW